MRRDNAIHAGVKRCQEVKLNGLQLREKWKRDKVKCLIIFPLKSH